MSFSMNFVAKSPEVAARQLDKEYAPVCIKALVEAALAGCDPGKPVQVMASGHVFDPRYPSVNTYSSVDLKVTPLTFVE